MEGRKEGNVLFNDALNTFHFTFIWHRTTQIVREETRCLPHGLLFPINSKGSFICMIPSINTMEGVKLRTCLGLGLE